MSRETAIDGTATDYSYLHHNMTRVSDGRVHTEFRHAKGNVFKVEEGLQSDTSKRTSVICRYDAADRLVRTINSKGNATFISYDARDRKIRQDDLDMGVWTCRFNSFGELEQQRDAKGQISQTRYDQLGRITQAWDVSGTEVRTWETAQPGIGGMKKITYREYGEAFDHYEKTFQYDA